MSNNEILNNNDNPQSTKEAVGNEGGPRFSVVSTASSTAPIVSGNENPHGRKRSGRTGPWEPKRRMTVMAVIVATIGSFGLGTVLSWSAIALKSIEESKAFGDISNESKWIASLALLGALISAPFTGFFISVLGRKKTMLITALPCLVGWLCIAFAQNVWMLYVGRFITGFCGGAFTVAVPAYVSEVTEDRIRGVLGTVMILMLCTGVEFTYIVGALLDWFWLSIICSTIPVIFFVSMLFMPESPRYLILQRKPTAARRALQWLRRASTMRHIEPEVSKIQSSVKQSTMQSNNIRDLLRPSVLKPIGVSLSLVVFGQMSGVNGVSLYTVSVFQSAGTEMDPGLASIIFGGCQLLTVLFVPTIFIETLGRKTLLVISQLTMVVGFAAFGTYFYLSMENEELKTSLSWLPLTSLVVVIVGYNIGMGPIPWVITSEIIPFRVKDMASSVITVIYWSLSFATGVTFQELEIFLGRHILYYSCSAVCFVGFLFVVFLVPETKGKTAEEIQEYFGGSPPTSIRNSRSNSPSQIIKSNHAAIKISMQQCTDLEMDPNIYAKSDGLDNPAFDNKDLPNIQVIGRSPNVGNGGCLS